MRPRIYSQLVADVAVQLYGKLTKSQLVAAKLGISHCTVLKMVREYRRPVRRVGRPSRPDRDPVLRRKGL